MIRKLRSVSRATDNRGAKRGSDAGSLWPGQRLSQPEFHRRYKSAPASLRAELIEGRVSMPSPLSRPHATYHASLCLAAGIYRAATPGLELLDNATVILNGQNEVQPDLALRIVPSYGGQSETTPDDYVAGPPEWIAEIARDSRAADLHAKRRLYQMCGVAEYVVLCIDPAELLWFDFRNGRQLVPNREGIVRSRVFPGLWLAVPALLADDPTTIMTTVQRGIASRAHRSFVAQLQKSVRPGTAEPK